MSEIGHSRSGEENHQPYNVDTSSEDNHKSWPPTKRQKSSGLAFDERSEQRSHDNASNTEVDITDDPLAEQQNEVTDQTNLTNVEDSDTTQSSTTSTTTSSTSESTSTNDQKSQVCESLVPNNSSSDSFNAADGEKIVPPTNLINQNPDLVLSGVSTAQNNNYFDPFLYQYYYSQWYVQQYQQYQQQQQQQKQPSDGNWQSTTDRIQQQQQQYETYNQQQNHLSSQHQLMVTMEPPLQNGLPCKSLYVGNLHEKITETLLHSLFSEVGPVESCKICKEKSNNQSYGFVDFYDPRYATLALQQLNGKNLYGLEIKVNWATNATGATQEDTSNHYHLFIGDLSPEINDEALTKAFSIYGSLSEARVMTDSQRSGHSRGYGFVAFRNREDAHKALTEMNGEWLGGRPIRCNWATRRGANPLEQSIPLEYTAVANQSIESNRTVYIGNIAFDITYQVIQQAFSEFGPIEEIRLQAEKGFAFIRFSSHEQAAKAIVAMNGKTLAQRVIKCAWGKDKITT